MDEKINEDNIILRTEQYDVPGMESKPDWKRPQFDPVKGPEYIKKRRGMGICIISRGTVPIKWMMHMQRLMKFSPGGLFWKYIVVERLSWAAARSECVRKCRANNFKWLLFIDDDVFLPDDAITRLLKAKKDIVTGIYWTKAENTAPVIFEEMGGGPMYDFPVDKLIEIGGSGAGCLLINMDIFDKFDEKGIPYFVENWIHTAPDGNKMRCPIGEDHYFFIKAKELGYQAWCDTGLLCDHYDHKRDKIFPGDKVVREIVSKKLKSEGREDVIKAVETSIQDPNKKTIIFYNEATFSGDELERRGVGGAETCIIHLAREFYKQGHNVRIYSDCLRPARYNGVWYIHYKEFENDVRSLMHGVDLLIVSRQHKFVLANPNFKPKQKILWAHDMAEDPIWDEFNVTAPLYDKVVMLSEFHKKELLLRFPNIESKTDFVVIGNGVDPNLYKDKLPKVKGRCIYSSTPFRGLDVLLEMWPKIRKRVPHAELYIFSSIKVYGEQYDDSPWDHLFTAAKQMEGVVYHGGIPQHRLAQEQMKSELLLYPNTFKETYCITAAECQTAGTPVITTKLGALPETVKRGCGVLIGTDPHMIVYQQRFINVVVELLTDDKKLDSMRQECLKHDFSWTKRAKQWLNLFSFGNERVECEGEVNPTNSLISAKQDPSLSEINEALDAVKVAEEIKESDKAIIGDTDKERDEHFKELLELPENIELLFNYDEKRYNLFKQFISQDYKVLVANCGLGELPRFLHSLFPKTEIWGTDKSLVALDYCRQSNKKILFANHPVENHDFESNYFNVIFVEDFNLIIHKPEFLKQINNILTKDGVMICTMPIDYWNPYEIEKFFKDGIVRFHKSEGRDIIFSVRWKIK